MNGNDFFVTIGTSTTPIAGTTSDDVKTGCDLMEVSSPTDGQWKQYIPGRKEWNLDVAWLVSAGDDLQQLLNIGTTYTINFYSRSGGTNTKRLTGTAICKNCHITGKRGNLVQGSFSFVGNGALEEPST